jgi:hypothetical protein
MDHRLFNGGCTRVQSMQVDGPVQGARSNILIINPQAVHAPHLSALAEWREVHGPLHLRPAPARPS